MYGSIQGKINIRNTLGWKYIGKDDIQYIPMNRLRSITGQHPLEKNESHAKNLSKPRQKNAISTSYSFLYRTKVYMFFGLET